MDKKTGKQPPVDRGKLLIGLECCRNARCDDCPYDRILHGCDKQADDCLAYISWLEEHLEEVTGHAGDQPEDR